MNTSELGPDQLETSVKRSKLRTAAYAACLLYALLLIASHLVWSATPHSPKELAQHEYRVTLVEALSEEASPKPVSIFYRDRSPAADAENSSVIVFLHDSPGSSHDFAKLEEVLAPTARLVVPDLPGFGQSQREVASYSIESQTDYVHQLIDELAIERFHLVGYGLGSGIALHLADQLPSRIQSLTLLAGTGVQEHELFGDYDLNHHVHRVLHAATQAVRYGVPHFGAYDQFKLNHTAARSYFDTDLRTLRELLQRERAPLQLIHGKADLQASVEGALEIHRIVPHSEMVLLESGHALPTDNSAAVAESIKQFVDRASSGTALRFSDASEARLTASTVPFDSASVPPISGFALVLAMLLIAAATLLTEDLTCIAVGLVIAQGRIGYIPGTFACFCGIFFGDVLLYLMGRFIGRAAMGRRPLSWWLTPTRIDRASVWFETKGMQVIFVSRFLPGFRVPTYFAAGVLKTHFLRFATYFAIAVALWTPVLVGVSMWAGHGVADSLESMGAWAIPALIGLALAIYFVQSLALPMFSHRGRRFLVGRLQRKLQWEFWPPAIRYAPVAIYVLWLAIRHRSLTLFTTANPGIPTGGFIGESKSKLFAALGDEAPLPRFITIPAECDSTTAIALAERFQEQLETPFPIVLKPDSGHHGSGVLILANETELAEALQAQPHMRLLQEFVEGKEYGIFWVHVPGEEDGRIVSIAEKVLPTVHGDGKRTLEELILDDPRAVCLASVYLDTNAVHIMEVPAQGEVVQLIDLCTHSLGAICLDGSALATSELGSAISELAAGFEGFHFGRFDIRVPCEADLAAGKNLKILELGGVMGEASHIYDPRIGLRQAYTTLFEQWRLAFEIGSLNAARGAPRTTWRELLAAYRAYRKRQAGHVKSKKSTSAGAQDHAAAKSS